MHTNPSYVQLTAKQQVCLEGGGGENQKYAVSSRPSFQVSLQGIGKSKLRLKNLQHLATSQNQFYLTHLLCRRTSMKKFLLEACKVDYSDTQNQFAH